MSLDLQWLTKDSAEIVGRTRALCYAPTPKEIEVYQQRLAGDSRVLADDLLLAQRDGVAIGTATSYSMTMWLRGRPFPCQGVAWVGTVKTHRRSGGVATQIMHETLRKARERKHVLSALMPFRASYYDHFGYGLVERRATWTIPLSILPTGPTNGFTFLNGADEARRACRQRMVEAGQSDMERSAGFWEQWAKQEDDCYAVGDRSDDRHGMRSWFVWEQEKENGKEVLKIFDCAYDSIESLRRGLNYFATLKDQYHALAITLPADFQLNRLLNEGQVSRAPLNHPTAEVKTFTRMQVRVIDHIRLIGGLRFPEHVKGQFTVAINETEGVTTQLKVEIESGCAKATPAVGDADIECSNRRWATMVLGDLRATHAAEMGLIKVRNATALPLMDAFASGPAPFCNEYF